MANNRLGFRPIRLFRGYRKIDDAGVTQRTGRGNALFLSAVQQRGVKLGIDLHIPRQAHHVLLSARQIFNPFIQIRQLAVDALDLRLGGDHVRMSGLQTLILFFVLLFELNAQRLHFGSLLEQYFGLGGYVDRAMLLPVSAQALLRLFQALLDNRQLAFQETQLLRSFRRFPIDCRVDINGGDVVDRFSELLRITAL